MGTTTHRVRMTSKSEKNISDGQIRTPTTLCDTSKRRRSSNSLGHCAVVTILAPELLLNPRRFLPLSTDPATFCLWIFGVRAS